jgi:hypothetical protein
MTNIAWQASCSGVLSQRATLPPLRLNLLLCGFCGCDMGVINNNAIIATTRSDEKAAGFQSWIDSELSEKERELIVRTGSWVNGFHSFAVMPDGSKEGWEESDAGDAVRERVVTRLGEDNDENGSSPWKWVEVGFGEYGQKVLRGNCRNCYSDAEYAA